MMLRILLSLILLPVFVSAENVTLNFRETDIKEVINIISEVTQKTFIVDPRVNAKVTIISNESMDSEQVYEVFLSILSIHGFTAVPNGNVIKILPYNLAKSESSTVLLKDETLKSDILVTQIVHIKHVEAAKLIPLLRPLIRQQGHLVAYPTNNTLIISDTANNIQRLLKIIQRIDQADDQNIEIIVLEHASATEVVLILSKLEQKTTQKTKKVNIVADKRSNSILISGDSAMRLRLRTLITHLDTPIKSMSHTKVIYLRYAQAKELVNILKGISDSIWETEKAKGQTISPNMFKTDIQADETTNSLVITAPPKILQNLTEVINKLDIRRAQVLVEAVIAEVSSDTARELGMQWL
ncbi:MAG: type II secretion system protein GspD, partial [Thiomargarita sp.]|nr:type II secretion system protein GspD [Thiomargarita sp.]